LKLMSTEQSLQSRDEPRIPSAISGLENFSLSDSDDEDDDKPLLVDADSLFNLPDDDEDEDDDK